MYLEPRTDVPAKDDWSTKVIVSDQRSTARWSGLVAVIGAVTATCLATLQPATPGTIATVVVLGLVTLVGSMGPLMYRIELAPLRRGLLDEPWRRCPATVAADEDDQVYERVLVFEEAGTLVLRGMLADLQGLLLDRQELFLCGPDSRGRAVVRVAGLCRMFIAKVDRSPARPREREPHVPGRPLDDPAVARAFRFFRWGVRAHLWPMGVAGVGAVLVLLGLWPLSFPALIVGGLLVAGALLLLPSARMLGSWYAEAAAGMSAAASWTQVPVTMFPWEANHEVSALAQLPGGMALVQFPMPHLDVIANIADTGTMWAAGSLTGVVAVGVPRVPALTFAVVQPDKDKPDEEPLPWLPHGKDPALREIPILRR